MMSDSRDDGRDFPDGFRFQDKGSGDDDDRPTSNRVRKAQIAEQRVVRGGKHVLRVMPLSDDDEHLD